MSNYGDSSFTEDGGNTSWYKALQLVREGSTVLDVGCSTGNFGDVLVNKKSCTVDGIELDTQDAAEAATKLRKVWILNIETDDLSVVPSKTYDLIYLGDVIEHLVDPVAALGRLKKFLKPNGRILFSIPNMGHLGVRLALLAGKFEYTETGLLDKTHLHFYTQDEVVRVFGEAGYAIDKLDFVEKDYPKQLIEDVLRKYGLSADETFYKKMSATNASAFQFVGYASPSQIKHTKLKKFGPIDLFESYFTNTVNPLKSEISTLNKRVKDLEHQNSELRQHWHELKTRPVRYVAKRVKNKLKK